MPPRKRRRRGSIGQLQSQVDEQQAPKSDLTVRRAVEQWLEVVELEATTRERYDDLIRLYLLPTFGDLKAAKLDAELLGRFYARLHRCRDVCSGKARAGHVCRHRPPSFRAMGRATATCPDTEQQCLALASRG